nr:RNA-dependent RNA polymerase [Sarcosphaera coronaria partitivirus]
MPVQSTLGTFTVLKNLRFLQRITEKKMQRFGQWNWEPRAKAIRDEFVIRKMREHFTEDVVQATLRKRRSDQSDEAVIADFMKNEQPLHYIPRDYHYKRALRVVTEQMRPNRILHPVTVPDLRAYHHTLNVSAELPWTNPDWTFHPANYRDIDLEAGRTRLGLERSRRRLVKWKNGVKIPAYLRWKQELELIKDSAPSFHNLYNEIFVLNRHLIHEIKNGAPRFWKDSNPIPYERLKLHLRAHVVDEDKPDKVRAVFGAPKLLTLSELMFIWPLQATYQNSDTGRMFWNREIARGGWQKIMQEFHHARTSTYISMDWSEFDRRLLHELIDDVHEIWRSYFDFSRYEATTNYPNPTINDPHRIERLWNWTCASIKNTPIELPDGTVWQWTHNGFGSGYQQTQLMDSFCNMIMTYTVLSKLGVDIEHENFKSRFQGDDAILGFSERMFSLYGNNFLNRMRDEAAYYFNAKLNHEKSTIGDHPNSLYVLGYNQRYGIPTRTSEDLLSHLMFPERPQDLGRLAASAVGLCYASLGCDEAFYNMTKDIFESLTNGDHSKLDWKSLKWMKRAGMFEIIEQMKTSPFPELNQLREQGIHPVERSGAESERTWPLKGTGEDGEIVFLNKV